MALNDIMGLLGRTGEVIGGGTPGLYGGLLSEEELRQAKSKASTKALFDLSASLAEAARPQSGRPIGTFGAIAKGLSAAQQGYQGTLQQQAKEKLAMQEMQRQMQAKQRAADAQKLIAGAYRPAQAANIPMIDGERAAGPVRPEIPAGFDLQAIAPQLMRTAEGRASLSEILGAQKAMRGEAFNLGEGDVRFVTDAFGNTTQVAAGAPKVVEPKLASSFAEAVDSLGYVRKPASEYTPTELSAINAKAAEIDARTGTKITNVVNPLQPDKKTAGALQETLLNAGDRRMRYNQIDTTFDPKFLTVPYRTEQAWTSLKEKFVELPEEQKAELRQFANWKQNSVNNLSLTIKELTGAAMGVEEAKRIIAGLPNPGTGLTDGDSPTEFKAKLDQTIKQMRMVEARTTYLLRNGLTLDKVPLEKMPSIINERGKEIATKYKLDPSKPRDLDLIKKQLSAEFGISTQ